MTKKVIFERRFQNGDVVPLGEAYRHVDGWRFYPFTTARQPSRKSWPTWEMCCPAWVGYPNKCETRVVCEGEAR